MPLVGQFQDQSYFHSAKQFFPLHINSYELVAFEEL